MKSLLKYAILLFTMLLVLSGTMIWLLGTSNGTRQLIEIISYFSSIKIEAGSVTGRLIDGVRMEEVNVDRQQIHIKLDKALIRLKPAFLPAGGIIFGEVILHSIHIQDSRPESKTPVVLKWPDLHGIWSWFPMEIQVSVFDELIYQRPGQAPVIAEKSSIRLVWERGILRIEHMAFDTAFGRGQGHGELRLLAPGLMLDFQVTLKHAIRGMDDFFLQMSLLPDGGSGHMAGTLEITGKSGNSDIFLLKGNLGLTSNAIEFQNLVFSQFKRPETITADGKIIFSLEEPWAQWHFQFQDFDLAPEMAVSTRFAGDLQVEGTFTDYQGSFRVENQVKGWQSGHLSGNFSGDSEKVNLFSLDGKILEGTVTGEIVTSWSEKLSAQVRFEGRDLNLNLLNPQWRGKINIDLNGLVKYLASGQPEGHFRASLLPSQIWDKTLTGSMEAKVTEGMVILENAELKGHDFDLSAQGLLAERLQVEADISDLSKIIPGLGGTLMVKGWVRRQNNKLAGVFEGQGQDLRINGATIGALQLEARFDERGLGSVDLKVKGQRLGYKTTQADSASLDVTGELANHRIEFTMAWPGGDVRSSLEGAYLREGWQGHIISLSGAYPKGSAWSMASATPLSFSAGSVKLGPLTLSSQRGEMVQVGADLTFHPLFGFLETEWQGLQLDRAQPFLALTQLFGYTSGTLKAQWPSEDGLRLHGQVNAEGDLQKGSLKLKISRILVDLNWDEKGLLTVWELALPKGGQAHGQISSASPAHLNLPPEGKLQATWEGIDLSLLQPWIPSSLALEGGLSGQLAGDWLPGWHLNATGGVKVSQGGVNWKEKNGQIMVRLKAADLNMVWMGETLTGEISLALEKYGYAKGAFKLPLPAHFPVAFQAQGPLSFSFEAQVQEKGLIQTLYPDWVQDSQAKVDLKLTANGTWAEPGLEGQVKLTGAGAYLPVAGVHLKEMGAEALFTRDRIQITSLRLHSGEGHIEGTAVFQLKNLRIANYQGRMKGERFQTVYLPELQVLTNPNLEFDGSGEKLTVRGEVVIPELTLSEIQREGMIKPSPDLVIAGEKKSTAGVPSLPVHIELRVTLGDKVQVKAGGIDARLTGGLALTGDNSADIAAHGEIEVAQGHYTAYGQELEIARGRILFDGPLDRPTIDVLALRKIGRRFEEVQAGVTATGSLQAPLIRLYSQPSMPETDILSYIILGRPMSQEIEKEKTALLMEAAGALLSAGEAALMKNQLSGQLGFDTLDIQAGGGDISRSLLTIGKYLNPRLYMGLESSLFTDTYTIILRYSLTKNIEIESKTGTESGASVYFKIEFE